MLSLIDTTTDFIFAIIFAISLLLTVKIWLEKMAINRSGREARGGEIWIYITIVSGVILAVINR